MPPVRAPAVSEPVARFPGRVAAPPRYSAQPIRYQAVPPVRKWHFPPVPLYVPMAPEAVCSIFPLQPAFCAGLVRMRVWGRVSLALRAVPAWDRPMISGSGRRFAPPLAPLLPVPSIVQVRETLLPSIQIFPEPPDRNLRQYARTLYPAPAARPLLWPVRRSPAGPQRHWPSWRRAGAPAHYSQRFQEYAKLPAADRRPAFRRPLRTSHPQPSGILSPVPRYRSAAAIEMLAAGTAQAVR